MLIAILIVAILIFAENTLIMFMIAVIVGNTKPQPRDKSYEQAQADLFKAWGDKMIKENKENHFSLT